MKLENKQIGIIGGGPGGLTLARLLQLSGATVQVYERDIHPNVRVQGATLDLHEESGLAALKRAGLTAAFYQHHRPEAGKLRITDKHTTIFLDDHASDQGYTEQRPEIDRGPLRKILLDSLHPQTVVWDSQFATMQPHGDGWMIHFKNGTSAYADLVVAADGANSQVRPYINDIKPIYSGITIVEGNVYQAETNVPELYKLVKGGKLFAFGDQQSLILSAKGDGSLSFYTGCKLPETWETTSGISFHDIPQVYAWFKQQFSSWDKQWQELFQGKDLWCICRPQYHYPIDQTWTSLPNLTMIGDAAHRMPPYAGEGVNMAMQDALELADCLISNHFQNIHDAIAHFEGQMLSRTADITLMTLENTEMLHAEDAIEKMMAMMQGE